MKFVNAERLNNQLGILLVDINALAIALSSLKKDAEHLEQLIQRLRKDFSHIVQEVNE